jgi:hypothetical protein
MHYTPGLEPATPAEPTRASQTRRETTMVPADPIRYSPAVEEVQTDEGETI